MAKFFSGFFDSIDGDERDYNETDLSRGFRVMCDTGVATLEGDNMKVFPADSGLRTRIGYGGAMVNGFPCELYDDGSTPQLIDHTLVVAYPRIDRVVLRLDLSSEARHIELAVIEGAEAASPVPPALTRSGTVYEISLAQCRVNPGATQFVAADIKDERGDATVCGNIREAQTYAAHLSQVVLAVANWAQNADKTFSATVSVAGVLLGNYVYTVSPTPETMRISGEAGGILMLTPTVAGQAKFSVPEKPAGAVTMVMKREVAKEA